MEVFINNAKEKLSEGKEVLYKKEIIELLMEICVRKNAEKLQFLLNKLKVYTIVTKDNNLLIKESKQ